MNIRNKVDEEDNIFERDGDNNEKEKKMMEMTNIMKIKMILYKIRGKNESKKRESRGQRQEGGNGGTRKIRERDKNMGMRKTQGRRDKETW